MKTAARAFLAFALIAGVTIAADAAFKSGPQVGDKIPAFDVVKCAGAADDGVKVGDELCYRCKYSRDPMVIVFTRENNKVTVDLVKQLNEAVTKNGEKKLRAFVNLIGENRDTLEANAKKLGTENNLAGVPVVVPVEFTNGPDNYGLNPKAATTVLLYRDGVIKANFAIEKGLTEETVQAVLEEVPSILN